MAEEGHRRATAHGATKSAALKAARKLVSQDGGGEVYVLNRTGKVAGTDTARAPRKRAA